MRPHLHPRSTERYDVREGKLHVWLGDDEHVLGQGTKLEIPPRTRHRFATPDDQPARVLCEFEPAGRFGGSVRSLSIVVSVDKETTACRALAPSPHR